MGMRRLKMMKIGGIVIGLCFMAQNSFANGLIINESIYPLSFFCFLAWLITGFILKKRFPDLTLINKETLILIAIGLLLCQFMMMVWMIYLGIVFVYFLFPKAHINSKTRILNLLYHGIFLGILIIGGIATKIAFWSNMGGFSMYVFWMKENYPVYLIMFLIISVIELAIIRIKKRGSKQKKEHLFP